MRIMDWQIKKTFSVLFAVLVGAGVILFAWKGDSVIYSGSVSGNSLWKDSLKIIPQSNTLTTISSSQGSAGGEATSTADIVARTLLANYALAQSANMSTTTLSDSDATAIARSAVSKIKLPQAVQYTIKDLVISGDNSAEALNTYVKTLTSLLQTFVSSQTKNDIAVAFTVPSSLDNSERLADIAKNIAHYTKLIKGLLSTKTPSSFAKPHLLLIQKYADIQANIQPMSEIFTDQVLGLAALAQYRNEISELPLIAAEFAPPSPTTQK